MTDQQLAIIITIAIALLFAAIIYLVVKYERLLNTLVSIIIVFVVGLIIFSIYQIALELLKRS